MTLRVRNGSFTNKRVSLNAHRKYGQKSKPDWDTIQPTSIRDFGGGESPRLRVLQWHPVPNTFHIKMWPGWMRCQVVNCRCYCRVSIGCEPMAKISTFQLAWSVVFKGNLHFHWARNGKNGIEFPNVREIHGASTLGMLSYWSNHCWWRPSTIQGVVHGASPPLTALGNDKFSAFLKHEILGCSRPTFPQIEISEHSSSFTRWGPLGPHSFQLYNPWRIHGAAIYGVPWIPSIYPIYVSIFLPAPWIRHG